MGKVDYNVKVQQLSDGIVKNLKFLGADGQILIAGKSGKVPPGQVRGTGNIAEAFRYFILERGEAFLAKNFPT